MTQEKRKENNLKQDQKRALGVLNQPHTSPRQGRITMSLCIWSHLAGARWEVGSFWCIETSHPAYKRKLTLPAKKLKCWLEDLVVE